MTNEHRKKIIYVLILPFLCITVLPKYPSADILRIDRNRSRTRIYLRAAIEIDGDGGLLLSNSNGSRKRTSDDPYVIENLEITGICWNFHKEYIRLPLYKNNNISVLKTGIHIEGNGNVNISIICSMLVKEYPYFLYIIISGNSIINPQNYGIKINRLF